MITRLKSELASSKSALDAAQASNKQLSELLEAEKQKAKAAAQANQ